MHPEAEIKQDVNELKDELTVIKREMEGIKSEQQEQRERLGVICRAIFAQLNHELSGNDVNTLKASRDEMLDYLTKK